MSWSIRWGQVNHRVLIRGREKVKVREGGHEPRNAGSLSKLENVPPSIQKDSPCHLSRHRRDGINQESSMAASPV